MRLPTAINVFAIGTAVSIGPDDSGIDATITAIGVYPLGTQYRVVWWNGRERVEEWLTAGECRPRDDESQRLVIGFSREEAG